MPVESTRPEQRGVEDLGAVRGRHEDDPRVGVEAVHLGEELVQGLLAFVVAPARHGKPARLPQGVELVDEDDAGGLLLGLLEEVPHPRRAEADEHLDELRAAQAEEGDGAFARHGLGEQRFPSPRRTHEQDALRDPSAETRELLRVLEKLDDLLQLLLRLVDAGHVLEGDLDLVLHVDLGLALAQRHETSLLPAHALHEKIPDAEEDHDRENPGEQIAQERALHLALEGHLVLVEKLREVLVHPVGPEGLRLARLSLHLHLPLDAVGRDGHLGDLPIFQHLQKLAVGYHLGTHHGGEVALDEQDRPHRQKDVEQGKLMFLFHGRRSFLRFSGPFPAPGKPSPRRSADGPA